MRLKKYPKNLLKNPFQSNFFLAIKDVLRMTVDQMRHAQLFLVASSLAYTTILSIVPLLAVSFAIFNAFGGLEKLYKIIEPMIVSNLAHGSSQEAIEMIQSFIDNTHSGALGLGGLIGLIFTSMSMLSSAENAINRVWQVKTRRSLLSRIYSYWFFITLGPLAFSVAVGVATSTSLPLSFLFPSGTGLFLMTVGLFFIVYQWVPHTRVNPLFSLTSAAITAALWNLARQGYYLYTKHVMTYSKIYGSLGAIPIILLWIYIVWVLILGGAALAAALQRRSTLDLDVKK